MRRAHIILPAGQWKLRRECGTVTLDWDGRHRRRIALRSDQGEEFLLDLPSAARLAQADGLELDDGRVIRVIAADEPVLEIRAGRTSLARLAYHLGNRHLPAEIGAECLVIRADPVIADMVRGLGGDARTANRPFTPEAGAYDGPQGAEPRHYHGHHHDHDHH